MPLVNAGVLQYYVFGAYDDEWAAVIGLGNTSLHNHSTSANADFDATTKLIVITATKKIKAGTEITLDYGWEKDHWNNAKLARK